MLRSSNSASISGGILLQGPAVLSQEENGLNDYLLIASVLKPQGVRGECKLRSYAADITMFRNWHTMFLKTGEVFSPVSLKTVRLSADGYVYAHINDSASAEEAEAFRGMDLYIHRDHSYPVSEDATLIADLIGCEAHDETGKMIGTLTDVLQYGTVDTWVFRCADGTLMAPALKSVFPEVDTEKRVIRVIREKLEEVSVIS